MVEKIKGFLTEKLGNKEKGFSLAELGIAMVIMLILATVAAIAYFTFIDNANSVKNAEDAGAIQTAVATMYAQEGEWAIQRNGDGTPVNGTVSDEVFQAIGATLSTDASGLRATNSTNGLVVSNEVLKDVDKAEWSTGNVTVPKEDAEAITISEIKDLVVISPVDFDKLKPYLGSSVNEDAVENYFVVTVK